MTINEILKEELVLEKRKISPDDRFELSKEAKAKRRKHKDLDWKDNNPNFLPGRERLVSAVCNMTGESPRVVRAYITKKFEQWFKREPEAEWIHELEEKAKKMDPQSFNPRDYRKSLTTPQPRGASAGADAKEHKGRAYFFVGLMNGFANHFKGKDENKDKRKKK